MSSMLLFAISVASLSFWLAIQMINPIFPLYLSDLGATSFEVGLIIAIPSLLSIFLRVPLASRAVTIGRVRFLGLALFINFISLVAYALANNTLVISIIRILHSFSIAAFGPVAVAYVSLTAHIDTHIDKRGEVIGTYLTFIALAIVIGPGLTALILNFIDLNYVFIFASIPSLILSIILLLYGRDNAKNNYNNSSTTEKKARNFVSIWTVLKNRDFLLVCIASLIYNISFGFFRAFFPLYAEEFYFLNASIISILYTIRGLFNVIIRIPVGKLIRRVGDKMLIIIGMLLTSISFLIISLRLQFYTLIIAMIIAGLGWGIRAVSSIDFIGDTLDNEKRDIGMAIFFNTFDIGILLGSIIGGFLIYYISYDMLFGLFSIILLFGCLLASFISEKR